jgi:GNAT superfamily N-acetyltransferase
MQPPLRPDGKIESVITYLEMLAPPAVAHPAPPQDGLTIVQAVRPTASFYRYLYDTVGEPWLWGDRRKLRPDALRAIVQHPDVEVHVLYAHGVPAGYAELDARDKPEIELIYFGLIPEFIGQKLGPYLLSFAIHAAWRRRPTRFWVHTCSLDHPSALGLYRRVGFQSYKEEVEVADDPRALGLIP